MARKPIEIERGERLAAVWEMSELAFSPVQDDDRLTFETEATGSVVEDRNGKRILYSCDPAEWPYPVHAVSEHMRKAGISTWTGSGKDLKLIVARK